MNGSVKNFPRCYICTRNIIILKNLMIVSNKMQGLSSDVEILSIVCSKISIGEIVKLSTTCKSMYVLQLDIFWRNIFLHKFGNIAWDNINIREIMIVYTILQNNMILENMKIIYNRISCRFSHMVYLLEKYHKKYDNIHVDLITMLVNSNELAILADNAKWLYNTIDISVLESSIRTNFIIAYVVNYPPNSGILYCLYKKDIETMPISDMIIKVKELRQLINRIN
jgi:hypothetical protein